MHFDIVGDRDPFLHVQLAPGESVYSESGAMVSMEATLDLTGEIRGGILGSLARKFVAGESLFTQKITAARGDGSVLLAPFTPGDIQLLEVTSHQQYILNDGAFLAAQTTVDLKMKMQSIGNALFGGTGGFFVVETKGYGTLAVSGFGSVFGLNVTAGKDLIIDNQHVVAWDSNLTYSVGIKTAENKGFLSNAVNSVTSGEGLITRFSGNGKVYLSSRNLQALAQAVGAAGVELGQQQNLQAQATNTAASALSNPTQAASSFGGLGGLTGFLSGRM